MHVNWLTEINQLLQVFAVTLLTVWVVFKWLQYRKAPPGPYGFPFLGYYPFLTKDPHLVFTKLAEKYGDIFSVKVGVSNFIVINEFSLAKKVLNHPATFARPSESADFVPGKGGFGNYHGLEWQEQRKFCVTAMKDLGLGRGEWESMIHEEVDEFLKEIRNWKGKPADYFEPLQCSLTGNILSLLIGRRLPTDRSDPECAVFINFLNEIMSGASVTGIYSNIPLTVVKIMTFLRLISSEKMMKCISDFDQLIRKEINKNMAPSNSAQKSNFLTKYLEEMKRQAKNEKALQFNIDSLVGNVSSLFLGGADTVKNSLDWIFLLMAAYPEVQQKVHQEIDSVIGKDRIIYWDDHNKLPYTMATINELQRWTVIIPLLPARWTLDDINIGDYIIPKGSALTVNTWNLMRSRKCCEEPNAFKPERFLTDDKLSTKLDGYTPFSVGKRNCPGEHVAMMTMFLYFSAIMQKFRVTCPSGKPEILKDKGTGLIRNAIPQKLSFNER